MSFVSTPEAFLSALLREAPELVCAYASGSTARSRTSIAIDFAAGSSPSALADSAATTALRRCLDLGAAARVAELSANFPKTISGSGDETVMVDPDRACGIPDRRLLASARASGFAGGFPARRRSGRSETVPEAFARLARGWAGGVLSDAAAGRGAAELRSLSERLAVLSGGGSVVGAVSLDRLRSLALSTLAMAREGIGGVSEATLEAARLFSDRPWEVPGYAVMAGRFSSWLPTDSASDDRNDRDDSDEDRPASLSDKLFELLVFSRVLAAIPGASSRIVFGDGVIGPGRSGPAAAAGDVLLRFQSSFGLPPSLAGIDCDGVSRIVGTIPDSVLFRPGSEALAVDAKNRNLARQGALLSAFRETSSRALDRGLMRSVCAWPDVDGVGSVGRFSQRLPGGGELVCSSIPIPLELTSESLSALASLLVDSRSSRPRVETPCGSG